MSHIISLNVTKFQQPVLITLGVADEKPEGGKKPPPRDIGLKAVLTIKVLFIKVRKLKVIVDNYGMHR